MPSNLSGGTSGKSFRVLAFDPGFERLGVAVVEKVGNRETLLFSDCIRTSATLSFDARLGELGAAVEQLLTQWQPDAMALEDIYFAKNAKTAMKVSEVRGMLSYLATRHLVPVFHYTPLQVKVAVTGYGQSDKKAVAMMVARLVTLPVLPLAATNKKIKTPSNTRLDDELDAIAVGLTCLASVRH